MAETVWGADQIERQHYTAECTGSGEYDFLCKRVSDTDPAATYMFPPIRRNAAMVGQNERLSPEEAALARVKTDFLTGDGDWFWRQAERFWQIPKRRGTVSGKSDEEKRCEDKKMTDENVMTMHCRAGHCSFWVDWQGNLVNCGMYASAKISLKERSFAEAWKELVAQTESMLFSGVYTLCNRNLSSCMR